MPTPRKHASHAQRQAAYRRRRQRLDGPSFPTVPGYPRWARMADWMHGTLEDLRSEMDAYYSDRSERWRQSDRADTFMEQLQNVSRTTTLLEDLSMDWTALCPTRKRKPPRGDPFDL